MLVTFVYRHRKGYCDLQPNVLDREKSVLPVKIRVANDFAARKTELITFRILYFWFDWYNITRYRVLGKTLHKHQGVLPFLVVLKGNQLFRMVAHYEYLEIDEVHLYDMHHK
jgi:hypothetical protein